MDINVNMIKTFAMELTLNSPNNRISPEVALTPECAGLQIFEPPIFAFGSPDDELFTKFKAPDVIGDHFLLPCEWLPGVRTVISFFLPYSEAIRSANAKNCLWPADEWLHGRIEGQMFVAELSGHICGMLTDAGYESLVPIFDTRLSNRNGDDIFTSNWSERHAAFACGLGTFGLSKGLITEKGMCGRFGSVLTAMDLPKDVRKYTDTYEYCSMCGLCIPQCPAGSISFAEGKNHALCSDFLGETAEKCKPRYGCGKCQVDVPCETTIP